MPFTRSLKDERKTTIITRRFHFCDLEAENLECKPYLDELFYRKGRNHMGKVAILVPREEMLYHAHNILQEKSKHKQHYEIGDMKVVRTKNVVMEARESIARGASMIIARGLQASLIKQYTDIPVIEIVITAQEMALLVVKAKQILKKENPVIAVVGSQNMFCDMSYFDSIYAIELRTFYAENNEDLRITTMRAVEEKVDLIIGGDVAVETAAQAGIPSLFLSNTEDSIRNAFSMADSVSYAMEVEKKNAAQMETLLDYSFGGVVNVDGKGKIITVNPLMEGILGQSRKKLTGSLLTEVFPDLDRVRTERVLSQGGDGFSAFLMVNGTSVLAMLAPVLIEGRVDGLILTCHKMRKKLSTEQKEAQKHRTASGLVALGRFEDISQLSSAMQDCIHLAKLFSLSDFPVLIEGEAGTQKRLLAQSIHNASVRSRNAFADISCRGLSEGEQFSLLFDEKGAAMQADGGTIFVEDGEYLHPANQYRILQLLRYKICCGKELQRNKHADVRVIFSVSHPGNLERAVEEGVFRRDLYYMLKGLSVRIPPLRECREDLEWLLEKIIRDCCERFDRYHALTREATELLLNYPWPGNGYQIENFCERLILTASKRLLDEKLVLRLLKELFENSTSLGFSRESVHTETEKEDTVKTGHAVQEKSDAESEPWADEREELLAKALKKYGGNRKKTAQELGISKSTLWRWMKRYGLFEENII